MYRKLMQLFKSIGRKWGWHRFNLCPTCSTKISLHLLGVTGDFTFGNGSRKPRITMGSREKCPCEPHGQRTEVVGISKPRRELSLARNGRYPLPQLSGILQSHNVALLRKTLSKKVLILYKKLISEGLLI